MTPERLDEIEARAGAATPGPWRWEEVEAGYGDYSYVVWRGVQGWTDAGEDMLQLSVEDAEFVSQSRTDVPELVAEVRRLRAALNAVQHMAWDPDCGPDIIVFTEDVLSGNVQLTDEAVQS